MASLLKSSTKILVDERDIYCLEVSSQTNQYINNVTHDMLTSAFLRQNVLENIGAIGFKLTVYYDSMVLYKVVQGRDVVYYFSSPIMFCPKIVELLGQYDGRRYAEISPFTMQLDLWYNSKTESKSAYEPYIINGYGNLSYV